MITLSLSYIYKVLRKIKLVLRTAYYRKCIIGGEKNLRVLGEIHCNCRQIIVGKNVVIYPGAYFWGNHIELGDNVNVGMGTVIYGRKKVYIGNNTSIAGQCYIIDSNHGTSLGTLIQEQEMETAKDGIYIGSDVWIGAQCTILKGAKINNGAVIGANSLVNKEIPENAIAFGIPAEVRKYRE